jgi:hypothetical protein
VYVFGGFRGDCRMHSVEKYSWKNDNWILININLATDLEAYSLVKSDDENVFILGGDNCGKLSGSIYLYNARSNLL